MFEVEEYKNFKVLIQQAIESDSLRDLEYNFAELSVEKQKEIYEQHKEQFNRLFIKSKNEIKFEILAILIKIGDKGLIEEIFDNYIYELNDLFRLMKNCTYLFPASVRIAKHLAQVIKKNEKLLNFLFSENEDNPLDIFLVIMNSFTEDDRLDFYVRFKEKIFERMISIQDSPISFVNKIKTLANMLPKKEFQTIYHDVLEIYPERTNDIYTVLLTQEFTEVLTNKNFNAQFAFEIQVEVTHFKAMCAEIIPKLEVHQILNLLLELKNNCSDYHAPKSHIQYFRTIYETAVWNTATSKNLKEIIKATDDEMLFIKLFPYYKQPEELSEFFFQKLPWLIKPNWNFGKKSFETYIPIIITKTKILMDIESIFITQPIERIKEIYNKHEIQIDELLENPEKDYKDKTEILASLIKTGDSVLIQKVLDNYVNTFYMLKSLIKKLKYLPEESSAAAKELYYQIKDNKKMLELLWDKEQYSWCSLDIEILSVFPEKSRLEFYRLHKEKIIKSIFENNVNSQTKFINFCLVFLERDRLEVYLDFAVLFPETSHAIYYAYKSLFTKEAMEGKTYDEWEIKFFEFIRLLTEREINVNAVHDIEIQKQLRKFMLQMDLVLSKNKKELTQIQFKLTMNENLKLLELLASYSNDDKFTHEENFKNAIENTVKSKYFEDSLQCTDNKIIFFSLAAYLEAEEFKSIVHKRLPGLFNPMARKHEFFNFLDFAKNKLKPDFLFFVITNLVEFFTREMTFNPDEFETHINPLFTDYPVYLLWIAKLYTSYAEERSKALTKLISVKLNQLFYSDKDDFLTNTDLEYAGHKLNFLALKLIDKIERNVLDIGELSLIAYTNFNSVISSFFNNVPEDPKVTELLRSLKFHLRTTRQEGVYSYQVPLGRGIADTQERRCYREDLTIGQMLFLLIYGMFFRKTTIQNASGMQFYFDTINNLTENSELSEQAIDAINNKQSVYLISYVKKINEWQLYCFPWQENMHLCVNNKLQIKDAQSYPVEAEQIQNLLKQFDNYPRQKEHQIKQYLINSISKPVSGTGQWVYPSLSTEINLSLKIERLDQLACFVNLLPKLRKIKLRQFLEDGTQDALLLGRIVWKEKIDNAFCLFEQTATTAYDAFMDYVDTIKNRNEIVFEVDPKSEHIEINEMGNSKIFIHIKNKLSVSEAIYNNLIHQLYVFLKIQSIIQPPQMPVLDEKNEIPTLEKLEEIFAFDSFRHDLINFWISQTMLYNDVNEFLQDSMSVLLDKSWEAFYASFLEGKMFFPKTDLYLITKILQLIDLALKNLNGSENEIAIEPNEDSVIEHTNLSASELMHCAAQSNWLVPIRIIQSQIPNQIENKVNNEFNSYFSKLNYIYPATLTLKNIPIGLLQRTFSTLGIIYVPINPENNTMKIMFFPKNAYSNDLENWCTSETTNEEILKYLRTRSALNPIENPMDVKNKIQHMYAKYRGEFPNIKLRIFFYDFANNIKRRNQERLLFVDLQNYIAQYNYILTDRCRLKFLELTNYLDTITLKEFFKSLDEWALQSSTDKDKSIKAHYNKFNSSKQLSHNEFLLREITCLKKETDEASANSLESEFYKRCGDVVGFLIDGDRSSFLLLEKYSHLLISSLGGREIRDLVYGSYLRDYGQWIFYDSRVLYLLLLSMKLFDDQWGNITRVNSLILKIHEAYSNTLETKPSQPVNSLAYKTVKEKKNTEYKTSEKQDSQENEVILERKKNKENIKEKVPSVAQLVVQRGLFANQSLIDSNTPPYIVQFVKSVINEMEQKLFLNFDFTPAIKTSCETKLIKELKKIKYQKQLKAENIKPLRERLLTVLCDCHDELHMSIMDDMEHKVRSRAVRYAFNL